MLRVGIPMDHPNVDRATLSSVAQSALLPLAGLSSGWQVGAPFYSSLGPLCAQIWGTQHTPHPNPQ